MPESNLGLFPPYVARRSQKGPPDLSNDSQTATDEYTVYIPGGKHPFEVTITGLPEIGDEWDLTKNKNLGKWKCDDISWSNTFPQEYWVASVKYRKQSKHSKEEGEDRDITKITYNPTSWSFDCEYDAGNGKPVKNTAGDRFQEALTTQIYTTSIVIETIEKTVPTDDLTKQGTINDEDIQVAGLSIPKHCGLFTITVREGEDEKYPFSVTRNIQVATNPLPKEGDIINPDGSTTPAASYDRSDLGFDACVLNAGYRYKTSGASGEELRRFVDETDAGEEVLSVDPHILKEDGQQAASGDVYWMIFQRYPESSWPSWLPEDAPDITSGN